MIMETEVKLARSVLWLRLAQMAINERYKKREFKIPIHLALGHEAIAVAVNEALREGDQLVLSHRNIHFNLLRARSPREILDEFLLKPEGLCGARHGSMNLADEERGVIYTSSILGNNLAVAAGIALGNQVEGGRSMVLVSTGDGAMEEGAFYEGLEFMSTFHLPAIVLVENNGWSLATQIHERRCPIALAPFAQAFGAIYRLLAGNDPCEYREAIEAVRCECLETKRPAIVEVQLSTLGDWRMPTPEHPNGKYINYHAGPAPTVELKEWPILAEDEADPVFVVGRRWGLEAMRDVARQELVRVEEALG